MEKAQRHSRIDAIREELAKLEREEKSVQQAEANRAFDQIMGLLSKSVEYLTTGQRSSIQRLVGSGPVPSTPRFQLPHSGATWSGRGPTPKAFREWAETVAYREWKQAHPKERFPPYRGLV